VQFERISRRVGGAKMFQWHHPRHSNGHWCCCFVPESHWCCCFVPERQGVLVRRDWTCWCWVLESRVAVSSQLGVVSSCVNSKNIQKIQVAHKFNLFSTMHTMVWWSQSTWIFWSTQSESFWNFVETHIRCFLAYDFLLSSMGKTFIASIFVPC